MNNLIANLRELITLKKEQMKLIEEMFDAIYIKSRPKILAYLEEQGSITGRLNKASSSREYQVKKVWLEADGMVHMRITGHHDVVLIISELCDGYYMSRNGVKTFPPPRQLVVTLEELGYEFEESNQ